MSSQILGQDPAFIKNYGDACERGRLLLEGASGERARLGRWRKRLAFVNFSKVNFGGTPKSTCETHVLPGGAALRQAMAFFDAPVFAVSDL